MANSKTNSQDDGVPLVDELGVEDIYEPIAGGRGRLFSTAGRNSPIAEFTEQFLVLRPPQKPFREVDASETIAIVGDVQGILLDEFGVQKKMPGARYRGRPIYWLVDRKPGTTRHFVAWLDEENLPHRLKSNGELLTTDMTYRLRNKTHDGELSIFPDLETE